MIREVKLSDGLKISDIYNYYILNTTVTFEKEKVSTNEMENRITDLTKKFPWLVYEKDKKVIGYAYASAWRVRAAYKYSVEITVYLENGLSGKGIGTELYTELLIRLKNLGMHGVIGGIALPNKACISLHEKFGFEKVAHFKEVGFKFDKWVDVAYWEKIL